MAQAKQGTFTIKCSKCKHKIEFTYHCVEGKINRSWVKCQQCNEVTNFSDKVIKRIVAKVKFKKQLPSLVRGMIFGILGIISLVIFFLLPLIPKDFFESSPMAGNAMIIIGFGLVTFICSKIVQ